MIKKEFYKFIPFTIAFALVLIHVLGVMFNPGYINESGEQVKYLVLNSVMFSGIGLSGVLLLILLRQPVWKYLCAIVMVAALTPALSFSSSEFFLGIMGINIELKVLGLLILHLVLNPDILPALTIPTGNTQESRESRKSEFEAAVTGFETRFRNNSVPELEHIKTNKDMVPAAREAARRLLENKSTDQSQ